MEFTISYGYNGLDYADYKEPGGNTKVKATGQFFFANLLTLLSFGQEKQILIGDGKYLIYYKILMTA